MGNNNKKLYIILAAAIVLITVLMVGNNWISKQVEALKDPLLVSGVAQKTGKSSAPTKKLQPVRIDPMNDPLAPRVKSEIEPIPKEEIPEKKTAVRPVYEIPSDDAVILQ